LEDEEDLEDQSELAMDSAETGSPWVAPTDPPILPGGRDNAEVAGSLGGLDDDDDDVLQHALTDDEISMRGRRLLRSDAATSMLRIAVSTEDGVVTLHGVVQTLEDTDNAAEVASRVPGVVEVIDELEVED